MISLKEQLRIQNLVFIDFETYYSTDENYDLKTMSMTEYIRDKRFKIHGLGLKYNNTPSSWHENLLSFNWNNSAIIAHNIKFDGAILAWKFNINPKLWIDTKGMAKAVLSNKVQGFSLKELAEFYGLQPKGKLETDGKLDLTCEEELELSEYCLHDVELCSQIFGRLSKSFPVDQYKYMDWTIRAFTEPRLMINVPVLERMVENEKNARTEAINRSGVSRVALSSNTKFADILRGSNIAIPTKISKRTGKKIPAFSLGDEGFLALKTSNPVLYEARKAAKSTIYETRGQKYINVGKTGLLPFDVEFSGAIQTHRFSGGNGAGGNPQNIPKHSTFREAITAPEGHQLIVGDFSQIELRILAYLSKEMTLIKQLESGTDIYSEFASKIFNRPITKDNKDERFVGKCAVLGLGYGMGAKRFRKQVKIQGNVDLPKDKAEMVVNLYRNYYKAIPMLWNALERLLPIIADRSLCVGLTPFLRFEHQAIRLPSGLLIQYPNLRWENGEWVYDHYVRRHTPEVTNLYGGKLTENICQALAGEICKEALFSTDFRAVGQVHDELLFVSDMFLNREQIQHRMELSPSWWPELKIKAEVGIGLNWKEAKV